MRQMYPLMLLIALLYSVAITAQNTLTYKELLGKELFFDKLADPDNMSCADCHAPEVGFTGPIPSINKHGAVYRGAVPQRFGNRKPPSSAYVTFSPIFHYDESEGIFVGGNFWDGRATGENLGNPAADQALGPFLNPVEQNNASSKAVLEQIAKSKYAWLWEEVWGEPLNLSSSDEVNKNYDRVGLAIAAYEASSEVNAFSSKFDFYNEGLVQLTPQEEWGLELFNGKGKCNLCHTSDGDKPLFTDFTFDNLGAPKNPENPFYDMDKVFLDGGSPINPYGSAWIDGGLGEFLASRADYADKAAENMGKHKVPTLRNVDKRPGNGFTKAYLHNGIFKSLKEVVHFYNTRDVEPWPAPEVADNVNTDELGNLGLTDAEENAIVAFMKTLSDGYKLSNKKAMAYEPNLEIAQELSLHLLGPNPFKDNIQLEYFLPDNAVVEIEAYNITGKKVQTIYAGSQTGGFHYANMKSASMSSGIYIIKLRAGNKTVAQKVVIE